MRYFSGQENRCNDVWPCIPNWFFASEVIDSDVLSCAVVDGAHRKNAVWANEGEELELWPQLAVKTSFERDLRKQVAHRLCCIRKGYVLCCQNAPIVQEFVHGGVLRHEIDEANWHLPTANAALRASAEVALHENAVSCIRIVDFFAWMQDVEFLKIRLRHAGRAKHSVRTGSDGMQVVFPLRCVQQAHGCTHVLTGESWKSDGSLMQEIVLTESFAKVALDSPAPPGTEAWLTSNLSGPKTKMKDSKSSRSKASDKPASLPVLVIEDNPALRERVCTTLESHGYPVAGQSSETDILRYLSSWKVVGLVVGSKEVNGLDAAAFQTRLSQNRPDLEKHVVVLTRRFISKRFLSTIRKSFGKPPTTERILLVDDEEPIREIMSEILAFAGYRCRAVAGGRQALKLLDSGKRFDLVTTDLLNFPMDGITFLEH
jgi:CheY-like chemotaxis protein